MEALGGAEERRAGEAARAGQIHEDLRDGHLKTKVTIERLRECRRLKLRRFACRADELNFTLCMFVKEVKKPNGDPYAPDSIFYLTLGIQVCSHQSVVGDPSGRQQELG